MNQIKIYETKIYEVISFWNGAAYTFRCKPDGLSAFFQGDDAAQFRAELDNFTDDTNIRLALADLWSEYEHVATPDGETQAVQLTRKEIGEIFKNGFEAGFDASAEGFNGEFFSRNYSGIDYEVEKKKAADTFLATPEKEA